MGTARIIGVVAAVVLTGLLAAPGAVGQGISIDFGGEYTHNPHVSIGHHLGAVTGATWNVIGAGGPDPRPLVDEDGDPTGGTLYWYYGGYQYGGVPTGVYDSGVMLDCAIWNDNDVRVHVKGLPANGYTVYAMVRSPFYLTHQYDVGIGVNDVLTWQHIGDASGTSTWSEFQNFCLTEVWTAGPTDSIDVVVHDTAEWRGILNGLQIIPVPEPATVALLAVGLSALALRRRRRNG